MDCAGIKFCHVGLLDFLGEVNGCYVPAPIKFVKLKILLRILTLKTQNNKQLMQVIL